MEMTIKSIRLEQFKGVQDKEFEINGPVVDILGQNGAGKTTIATAHNWLWFDKDYDLKSNPNIRPLDVEECTPRVEENIEIDGKLITVAKSQKRTVGKPNAEGVSKITLSNTYEINSVPKTERDFKAYFTDLGVDFDKMLALSHIDVFTSQKSVDMRKVLFGMASSKTDKEVAELTKGADDVVVMLDNYTLDEIVAIQKATQKKIASEYGKEGEILNAQIEGMEKSKSQVDVAELEIGKKALLELIKSNKEKLDDVSKQFEEHQKLSDGVIVLKFALNDLQRKANTDLEKMRAELREKITTLINERRVIERQITFNESDITRAEKAIERNESEIQKCRERWKEENERVFDENSLVCSYCGQEYPLEKKQYLRAEFEHCKTKCLKEITETGNNLKAQIDKDKEEVEQLKAVLEENKRILKNIENLVNKFEKQLNELPDATDISNTEEYKSIQSQIAEKEQALNNGSSAEGIRTELRLEEQELQSKLTDIEKMLALSSRNIEIDEQISELKARKLDYEQSKADCEKILYQIDLISKRKNELLSEDINNHFELVDFKLFDYQKNGEYKEVCVPTVKGKDMNVSTNTGLEIMMKLDIIQGLQKFYGQVYPVFIDKAECLSSETRESIEMDCQTVYLSVSECEELKILA